MAPQTKRLIGCGMRSNDTSSGYNPKRTNGNLIPDGIENRVVPVVVLIHLVLNLVVCEDAMDMGEEALVGTAPTRLCLLHRSVNVTTDEATNADRRVAIVADAVRVLRDRMVVVANTTPVEGSRRELRVVHSGNLPRARHLFDCRQLAPMDVLFRAKCGFCLVLRKHVDLATIAVTSTREIPAKLSA